jgi:hypothetical protein
MRTRHVMATEFGDRRRRFSFIKLKSIYVFNCFRDFVLRGFPRERDSKSREIKRLFLGFRVRNLFSEFAYYYRSRYYYLARMR